MCHYKPEFPAYQYVIRPSISLDWCGSRVPCVALNAEIEPHHVCVQYFLTVFYIHSSLSISVLVAFLGFILGHVHAKGAISPEYLINIFNHQNHKQHLKGTISPNHVLFLCFSFSPFFLSFVFCSSFIFPFIILFSFTHIDLHQTFRSLFLNKVCSR